MDRHRMTANAALAIASRGKKNVIRPTHPLVIMHTISQISGYATDMMDACGCMQHDKMPL